MAEYLRQVPNEIEDYVEYGHILFYKCSKLNPGVASPEIAANLERQYNRVKSRFEKDGRIRSPLLSKLAENWPPTSPE